MSEDPNEMKSLSQKNRLTALRAHLKSVGVDGCVVPRGDEYQGEFVAPYAERLAWLSGFTGSAGLAVVLSEQAALFVDGRYTLQVRDQVDDTLYAIRHVTDAPVSAWLKESLTNGQKLGFDPHLHTPGQVKKFRDACEKAGAALVSLPANPIDAVWQDQPARPQVPAKTHPLEIAGQSHEDKRKLIAETLHKDGHDAFLVTASDSLCWLFNIRGADVENTPLVLASALLFADGEAVLFMDSAKVTDDVRDHLGKDVGITGVDGLGAVIDDLDDAISTVGVDKATVSQWAVDRLETAGLKAIQIEDPCSLPKACKNDTEVEGVRAAHVRDGAALANFLAWLDQEVVKGNLTEVSVAERLEQFRRSSNFRGRGQQCNCSLPRHF